MKTARDDARATTLRGEDAGLIGPALLVFLGVAAMLWAAFFPEGWLS